MRLSKNYMYIMIALFMGIIFILTYGSDILNPTYTEWFFNGTDLTQHYLGWVAYRKSDWSFPIGNTDYLAYPSHTSVIFTDSIPCLAVFFKLLSSILPENFQYFGFWGILCYMLQGILTARIIGHFTEDKMLLVLSSILLSFTPVMIFRMYTHTSLGGQWIILLALETLFAYKSYSQGRRVYWIWAAIGVLASSTHIYFCMMCGMILVGYSIADIVAYKRIKRNLCVLAVYVATVVGTVWVLGGFSSNVYNDGGGFGMYSMNINALFNPQIWGSRIFGALPLYGVGQYEGFAWLGAGCIVLFFAAGLLFLRHHKEVLKSYRSGVLGLICVFLIGFLFALSPVVTLGNYVVCELKLPEVITKYWSVFRSTGRFVWVSIYILMISSCIVLTKMFRTRSKVIFLSACVALQIYDTSGMLADKKALFDLEPEYEEVLKAESLKEELFWNYLGNNEKIEHIVFFQMPSIYSVYAITDWALRNDKTVSQFRFARPLKGEIVEANLQEALRKSADTDIFLFLEDNEAECAKYDLNYYTVDGYIIGYTGLLEHVEPVLMMKP